MVTDPVSDLFTSMRNATMARKNEATVPYSKLKEAIAKVLLAEGYLSDVKKVKNDLIMILTFKRRQPVITGIKNISTPGRRIYRKAGKIPRPLGGAGISIVSTSEGVMSGKAAKGKKLGGEVLGEVW